jgi:hypothetical protein
MTEPFIQTRCKQSNIHNGYKNVMHIKENPMSTVNSSWGFTSQQGWGYSNSPWRYDDNQKHTLLQSSSVNLVSQIASRKKQFLFSSQILKSPFIDSLTSEHNSIW